MRSTKTSPHKKKNYLTITILGDNDEHTHKKKNNWTITIFGDHNEHPPPKKTTIEQSPYLVTTTNTPPPKKQFNCHHIWWQQRTTPPTKKKKNNLKVTLFGDHNEQRYILIVTIFGNTQKTHLVNLKKLVYKYVTEIIAKMVQQKIIKTRNLFKLTLPVGS